MNELYEAIEAKIKASGYPREISGEAVYLNLNSLSNCRCAFHTVWPKTRRYFFAHVRTF